MKRWILFAGMLLIAFNAFTQWDIYVQQSPDPENWTDVWLTGVNGDGEFAGSMFNPDSGDQITNIPVKGFFGSVITTGNPSNWGQLDYLHTYAPDSVDWNMGFFGMSESGKVTAFTTQSYDDPGAMPVYSRVLEYQNIFEATGFSSYDDIHVDSAVYSPSNGDADWIGGVMLDINTSGRAIGYENGGDAWVFNTNTGAFDYFYRRYQNPWMDRVRLYGIEDNNWAIGWGRKSDNDTIHSFILQVTSGTVEWTQLDDPHVKWGGGSFNSCKAAIANQSRIYYQSGETPPNTGNEVWEYNFATDVKTKLFEFTDFTELDDYNNWEITDAGIEGVTVFISGYCQHRTTGRYIGFLIHNL